MAFVHVRSWTLLAGGAFQTAVFVVTGAAGEGLGLFLAAAALAAPGLLLAGLSFCNAFPPMRASTFRRCVELALAVQAAGWLLVLGVAASVWQESGPELPWLCLLSGLGLAGVPGLWKFRSLLPPPERGQRAG